MQILITGPDHPEVAKMVLVIPMAMAVLQDRVQSGLMRMAILYRGQAERKDITPAIIRGQTMVQAARPDQIVPVKEINPDRAVQKIIIHPHNELKADQPIPLLLQHLQEAAGKAVVLQEVPDQPDLVEEVNFNSTFT